MKAKLLLPLQFYDDAGRMKPPRFFWFCSLFLAKAYFIFVVALSARQDTELLLAFFYPKQSQLYLGLAIGTGALLSMLIVAFRAKWWDSGLSWLGYMIKPLLLITLFSDWARQIYFLSIKGWSFSWPVASLILVDGVLLYWIVKSRHLRWMIRDWCQTSKKTH